MPVAGVKKNKQPETVSSLFETSDSKVKTSLKNHDSLTTKDIIGTQKKN